MTLLDDLAGIKPTPKPPAKPRVPCTRQSAGRGGYASDIIHERFQIIQSYVFDKKYIIVDHDTIDGLTRSPDERVMVFENVKDAEAKIEILKLKPAPVSRLRLKKSFRDQLAAEDNKPLTMVHHNAVVDIEKFPAEGSSIRLIYDLIMAGNHTGKIESEVLKKFPNAPHRANFIDDYRDKLIKAGKFNGVVKQPVDLLSALIPTADKPKKVLFVAKKPIDTVQDNQPKKFVKIGLKKA